MSVFSSCFKLKNLQEGKSRLKEGKMRKGDGQEELSNIHYLAIVVGRKCTQCFTSKDGHKIDGPGSVYCRHCFSF